MKKRIILFVIAIQTVLLSTAQISGQSDRNLVYKGQDIKAADTTSLLYALKKGQFDGHFRYFFMSTQNEKGLTDYYANAVGGGIRYESGRFHNFQFAMSGFSIFNIGSSNLAKPDSLTGQYSRYEIGLFDITNPSNKSNMNRLEEFYLKYNYKNSFIKAGRQFINSAFINLQDGRMQPTGVSGVLANVNEIKKVKIQLGWLWSISPRSTMQWYSPGASMGLYSVGVNPDGTKSGYAKNIKSHGLALVQVNADLSKNIRLQMWDMYVENVFNTSMFQLDYVIPLRDSSMFFTSMQSLQQFSVKDGGNANEEKTYFRKGSKSLTFGARAGWRNNRWEATLNYNRITNEGRYLIPREWGFDPFFTFLPREKNDGFANVNAYLLKIKYKIPQVRLTTSLAAGYYQLPDVKNYAANKYGMPSYGQINGDINYIFANAFQGLEARIIIVGKADEGNTYDNYKYVFNKVAMVQYNFILNYHF